MNQLFIKVIMQKPKKIPPLIEALQDPNDVYGKEYRRKMAPGEGLPRCIVCWKSLPSYCRTCSVCRFDFNFCKKCYKDHSIFINPMRCIFCERERNDNIVALLQKLSCDDWDPSLCETDGWDMYHTQKVDFMMHHLKSVCGESIIGGKP